MLGIDLPAGSSTLWLSNFVEGITAPNQLEATLWQDASGSS
jgi:hypothetical protein